MSYNKTVPPGSIHQQERSVTSAVLLPELCDLSLATRKNQTNPE